MFQYIGLYIWADNVYVIVIKVISQLIENKGN